MTPSSSSSFHHCSCSFFIHQSIAIRLATYEETFTPSTTHILGLFSKRFICRFSMALSCAFFIFFLFHRMTFCGDTSGYGGGLREEESPWHYFSHFKGQVKMVATCTCSRVGWPALPLFLLSRRAHAALSTMTFQAADTYP